MPTMDYCPKCTKLLRKDFDDPNNSWKTLKNCKPCKTIWSWLNDGEHCPITEIDEKAIRNAKKVRELALNYGAGVRGQ